MRVLRHVEEIVCGVFLVTMISLVTLNVFLRYVFGTSISWSEEVATACFVWLVFVGASATFKHQMDIGIDVLVNLLPPQLKWLTRLAVSVLLVILSGYLFYLSLNFTIIAWPKPTAVLGVSSAVFNSALVVGFGLITIHSIRFLAAELKGGALREVDQ